MGALAATTALVALAAALVTVLARQARQRAEIRERLGEAQRLEALGRMTGGIAHDFNNVLHVIATNLEVLRRAFDPVPLPVEAAIRAVRQGTEMATQLLVFARRRAVCVEPVNVNRLLAELMPLLRQAAGDSVQWTVSFTEDLWPCLADPAELSSALLNLVINARDAMPDGTGTI